MMPAPARNIKKEMRLFRHSIYGPLFYKFKENFRNYLEDPGDYLPKIYKTDAVLKMLEDLTRHSGIGDAILDMLAYAALQTVRGIDDSVEIQEETRLLDLK